MPKPSAGNFQELLKPVLGSKKKIFMEYHPHVSKL